MPSPKVLLQLYLIRALTLLIGLSTQLANAETQDPTTRHDKLKVVGLLLDNTSVLRPLPFKAREPVTISRNKFNWELWNLLSEESFNPHVAFLFLKAISSDCLENVDEALWAQLRQALSYVELTEIQRTYLANKLAHPVSCESQSEDSAIGDSVQLRAAPSPRQAFDFLNEAILELPRLFPYKRKIQNSIKFLENFLLGDTPSCYDDSPDCTYSSNKGIRDYLAKALESDSQFLLDSIKFYTKLRLLDATHPYTNGYRPFDSGDLDLYKLALSWISPKPRRALRVLTVFGHDQCCNGLVEKSPSNLLAFSLLNELSPTVYSDDTPHSHLQSPGSLGGVVTSRSLRRKYRSFFQRYKAEYGVDPDVRSNYYHVYGGALSSLELVENGYAHFAGLKYASFVSTGLGYYYKKFTMNNFIRGDAAELWKQMDYNEDSRIPEQTESWTPQRYIRATLDLEKALLNLENTLEQHRAGADFVYRIFLNPFNLR